MPTAVRRRFRLLPLFASAVALLPTVAQAAPATLDRGDTAWMLTATALVLLMTLPGLALFYAGMVRAKNVLSVMAQCLAIVALVSVLWCWASPRARWPGWWRSRRRPAPADRWARS